MAGSGQMGRAMKVLGLSWLGTSTDRFVAMVRFYEDVMGLTPSERREDFAEYRLPNGDVVDLFGPSEPGSEDLITGPVAGFRVEDVAGARAEMEGSGVEFLGPIHGPAGGYRWSHFRAPDGTVYEIVSFPS